MFGISVRCCLLIHLRKIKINKNKNDEKWVNFENWKRTWDHSMATHWGQTKALQICRVIGRGEWVHFHSSTWENCPWVSSSTHSTLRSCQPPSSPQDTEHWVQGPCSQLHTHRTEAKLTQRFSSHLMMHLTLFRCTTYDYDTNTTYDYIYGYWKEILCKQI